jgi:hypothetical protein
MTKREFSYPSLTIHLALLSLVAKAERSHREVAKSVNEQVEPLLPEEASRDRDRESFHVIGD